MRVHLLSKLQDLKSRKGLLDPKLFMCKVSVKLDFWILINLDTTSKDLFNSKGTMSVSEFMDTNTKM